jgi:hypothetical protein
LCRLVFYGFVIHTVKRVARATLLATASPSSQGQDRAILVMSLATNFVLKRPFKQFGRLFAGVFTRLGPSMSGIRAGEERRHRCPRACQRALPYNKPRSDRLKKAGVPLEEGKFTIVSPLTFKFFPRLLGWSVPF